jgi:uncharacterized protein (TIGR00730 family)
LNPDSPLPPPSAIISCGDEDATFQVIQASVLELWKVVNNLARIQPSKHSRYRVTIFGSARLQPADPLYDGVRQLAGELTRMGCDIITGGGPGLMQAANEGSVVADPADQTRSIGVRINLGFEQETNPFVEQVYQHQTFFTRLHHFVVLSDAFVIVPGGIGTTLEAMMIWQLLQVRELHQTPLIMVGEMWADLVQWARQHMMERSPQMASPVDMTIPRCVSTCEEAIALLKEDHARWQHSTSNQPGPPP